MRLCRVEEARGVEALRVGTVETRVVNDGVAVGDDSCAFRYVIALVDVVLSYAARRDCRQE